MVIEGIGHNQQLAILSGAEMSDHIFWEKIARYNILLFCDDILPELGSNWNIHTHLVLFFYPTVEKPETAGIDSASI